MASLKTWPFAVFLLLCAGRGAQAQLQILQDALDLVPGKCRAPVQTLALSCLSEVDAGLKALGLDGLKGIAKLADFDLEGEDKTTFDKFIDKLVSKEEAEKKKNKKKKLVGIGERCCAGVEGLEAKKCGCIPEIEQLAEALGQSTFLSRLVGKFGEVCDIELSLRFVEGSCPADDK